MNPLKLNLVDIPRDILQLSITRRLAKRGELAKLTILACSDQLPKRCDCDTVRLLESEGHVRFVSRKLILLLIIDKNRQPKGNSIHVALPCLLFFVYII